jgi:ubiquinone biosynthesis accessory factor UbiJ
VPAHQLGRLAAAGLAFGRRLVTTAVTNAAEYFAHERADLVPRAEGEQFLRGVDALRDSVDRLQARLDLLARRRSAP